MNNETIKFCECETVTRVARDMRSTCGQCGGIDAYKKSKLREGGVMNKSDVIGVNASGTVTRRITDKERIQELEKELAKKEKLIRGQAIYYGHKHDQVERLEKRLVESVPKSELLELIISDSNNKHIGERHFELIKSLKSLTNHKE